MAGRSSPTPAERTPGRKPASSLAPRAAQTLDCGPANLPAGESFTVTVSAKTQAPEDCGDKNNPVATGDADDADPVTDSGNLDVLCGDLDVEKTPNEDEGDPSANDIVAGEFATFIILTTHNGDGIARGSELSDLSLPAVTNGWSILGPTGPEDPLWASCLISGDPGDVQELTCGPEDIEAGGYDVVLGTITTIEDCGPLFNPLAEVFSTNDGSDSDSGAIDVICPDVSVEKTLTRRRSMPAMRPTTRSRDCEWDRYEPGCDLTTTSRRSTGPGPL